MEKLSIFFAVLALSLTITRSQDIYSSDSPLLPPGPDCSAPCPQPTSMFCSAIRDENCNCQEICCAFDCPGGIDYDHCTSCSNCRCLPYNFETTSTSTSTTTRRPKHLKCKPLKSDWGAIRELFHSYLWNANKGILNQRLVKKTLLRVQGKINENQIRCAVSSTG